MQVCLPDELNPCPSVLSKQTRASIANALQVSTLTNPVMIARLTNIADIGRTFTLPAHLQKHMCSIRIVPKAAPAKDPMP